MLPILVEEVVERRRKGMRYVKSFFLFRKTIAEGNYDGRGGRMSEKDIIDREDSQKTE